MDAAEPMEVVGVVTAPVVSLLVVTPGNVLGTERRFQKDLTIRDLKDKLVLVSGASVETMRLSLRSRDGSKLVAALDDDKKILGSYPVENGLFLDIVDPTITVDEFNDVSKVEKFEISKDEYEKREDSVAAFKRRNKLGRFGEADPAAAKAAEEEAAQKAAAEERLAAGMVVGNRCQVAVPKAPVRRGMVAFNGTTHFKPGIWIGIKYDEPVGKNDGSVDGHRYFDCPPKYGGFVKPVSVTVGDFPEEDFSDDEI